MEYHFRIHREGSGYWAECIELSGCLTQADSREELRMNMAEALDLFLDEPPDSLVSFPLPRRNVSGKSIQKVPVSPSIAFAFLMRRSRLQHGITQKEASRRLGFKNLYSYQRLESGKTANPELSTLLKIRSIYPEFSVDLILGGSGSKKMQRKGSASASGRR
ncbi:MAG: type II toxin-antitoxin system HicB family antitoxin [Spirochaetales bacterium]|nr:type II toxin-antitoxin system HicB family antitoxin [Spirochaetales bacterium]